MGGACALSLLPLAGSLRAGGSSRPCPGVPCGPVTQVEGMSLPAPMPRGPGRTVSPDDLVLAATVTGRQLGRSKNKANFESLYFRPSGRPPFAFLIVHIWGQDFTEFPLTPYKVPARPTLGRPWPGRTEVVLRERSEVFKLCWLRNSWSRVTVFKRPCRNQTRAWAPRRQLVLPKPRQPGGLPKPPRVQCEGHRSQPGDTWRVGHKLSSRTHALTHGYSGI